MKGLSGIAAEGATRAQRLRRWLGTVVLVFAGGCVARATGLLLHEFAGHGLAARVLGCGVDGYDLSYFGGGSVDFTHPCARWTPLGEAVASWAGIGVIILVGLATALGVRLVRPRPLPRFLLLAFALAYILQSLGYVVVGGYEHYGDPAPTADALGRRGLGWLLWAGGALAYAAVLLALAPPLIDAFRQHFAPRSRLHSLGQFAAVVGVAGVLYMGAVAAESGDLMRLSRVLRERTQARVAEKLQQEKAITGRPPTPQRLREVEAEEQPFPIWTLLAAMGGAALALSMRRPLPAPPVTPYTDRAAAVTIYASAAALTLIIAVLDARMHDRAAAPLPSATSPSR